MCLQSLLGAPQTCPHEAFTPETETELPEVSQGGGWQVLAQACNPHCRVLPQSWLQRMPFDPQGMFLSSTWPPMHSFATGTEHGGQTPKWQVCEAECPQGWGNTQGWGHEGTGVPQARGGGIDVFPQEQVRSVKMVSRHGGQWPLWHSSWHECCPH